MSTQLSKARRSLAKPVVRRPASFTDQLMEPFSQLRDIDRLFDDLGFRFPAMRYPDFAATVPALEMTETKKAYKISAELPGMDAKDIEISLEDGMLRISGEKKTERDEDEKGYRLSERSYGAFERIVRLPAAAEPDKIKARYRNGVLTVSLPKDGKAAARVRKIAVE